MAGSKLENTVGNIGAVVILLVGGIYIFGMIFEGCEGNKQDSVEQILRDAEVEHNRWREDPR